MDKSQIEKMLEEKGRRVFEQKIKSLEAFMDTNFPFGDNVSAKTQALRSIGYYYDCTKEQREIFKTLERLEIKRQQDDFYNKVESIFYNFNK